MARMSIDEEGLSGSANLLPVEEEKEVNGIKKMVPIQYLAEITMSKESTKTSATGYKYLELTLSIDRPGKERINVRDILTYNPAGVFRLKALVSKLSLKFPLDTDEFLARFIFVTVKQEPFDLQPDPITGEVVTIIQNKISSYVHQATKEEMEVRGTLNPDVF